MRVIHQTVIGRRFRMHCFHFGTGPRSLVVLPGMSLHPVYLNADAVAKPCEPLTQTHTVYLFDRKDDMEDGYRVVDMAEDTAEAMQQLGLREADLFGCSQGGMIAQVIAARYPQLVHHLVLAAAMPRPNAVSCDTFDTWYRLAKQGDPQALNRDVTQRVYSPAYAERFREVFRAQESQGTPHELAQFAVMAWACRWFDAYEELPAVRCQTVVVCGENDKVLSSLGSRELAERLSCQLVILPGYGHAVYDECPDFIARLSQWLS